ncbi:unnamed protein product [Paramecium octaurelia]|uniref:Uncharacterized protein n=1 Tax=Paramecium octaurelia TaxID=43137 RepID=A0A8S1S4F0_PAROT|nr:unnamed protein product [Paramecium octaurelia]
MNKTYPSTEVWTQMNDQLQKSIQNNIIKEQELKNLNFAFEDLALLQHQLNNAINLWKSSSISQNDQYLLQQQIPLLLLALNQNLSTLTTMLILDLFNLMAFKNEESFAKPLIQNLGVPYLLDRLQDENMEICQKSFSLLGLVSKKYLNDIGALPILINLSKRIKIDSHDYFNLILEIGRHAQSKEHLQLICKYILQTDSCEPLFYLKKLIYFINKSPEEQYVSNILLEGQILSILRKIFKIVSTNSELTQCYIISLLSFLKQYSPQSKELTSNSILQFFNINVDKHNYSLTDLYTQSLYGLIHQDSDLIKEVIKNQQIINNLFAFYDQKAIANFAQIFNRVIEFDLDYEIKYLIKKGMLFKYYTQLNRNDSSLHSSLEGIHQLLRKGYIKDNLNQLQKKVRNSLVSKAEDKTLQLEIVRLIQQQKQ